MYPNKHAILCLWFSAFVLNVSAQVADKIAGVVGDKIILQSDIIQASNSNHQVGSPEYCQTLEELLFQKLLVYQAEQDSILISDEQLEQEMDARLAYLVQPGVREAFERSNNKSLEQFKEEFRERIRENMIAQKMQQQITQNIKITPEEIRDFYNRIPSDSMPLIGSQVEMAHIAVIPEITLDEKNKTIDELKEWRTQIMNDKSKFATLAVFYSQDPGTSSDGGHFELTSGRFGPVFDAVALNMKEGEISEIFETEFGFHIFLLEERRGELYRGKHILRIPKITGTQITEASKTLDNLYSDLVAGKISFKEAAIKFSNDDQTKNNAGLIFNPETGSTKFEVRDLDKQLFITIDKMSPEEVSQPVYFNSVHGRQSVRIVKLVSRTEPHKADLTLDYPEISAAALADKKEKAILAWIKEKSESVYIQVGEAIGECSFQYQWTK